MMPVTPLRRQRGITLVVGLIMLVLITLVVSTAFMLSTTNLKAVGNMQFRDEAIAAANVAVERLASSDFTLNLKDNTYTVDLDNDGTDDYTVDVATPVCVKFIGITLPLPETDPDSVNCATGASGVAVCYDTIWDITATVQPTGAARVTGAQATVRQGIKKRMGVTEQNKVCP